MGTVLFREVLVGKGALTGAKNHLSSLKKRIWDWFRKVGP